MWLPSPAVTAAARIKKKSIQQRLGVKARLSLPRRAWGGLRGWDSDDSLNSTDNTENRSVVSTSDTGFFLVHKNSYRKFPQILKYLF